MILVNKCIARIKQDRVLARIKRVLMIFFNVNLYS